MQKHQKQMQYESMDPNHPLVDRHQNFWQLASIQSAAFGLQILIIGKQLANLYGPGTALISIFVGNLILWIIGLATVAMAYNERKNAIENLVGYIGKIGSILGGLVLLFAFLFWFSLQIRGAVTELNSVLQPHITLQDGFDIRIGAALGLCVALLALGGIRLIKWTALISFPLLLFYILYAILMREHVPTFRGTWGISIPAIGITMAITLPGIVNLPTFFRHSRSRPHAFFALTLVVLFTSLIECSSIWLGSGLSSESRLFTYLSFDATNLVLIILFISISLVCVNLVNVYFASAAWEAMLPRLGGAKECAIVGMGGTIAFTFFQAREPLLFIENVLDSFIASLGMTILMGYLVRRIVNHRERSFEKIISVLCWICGCLTATYVQSRTSLQSSYVFFSGIGATGLAFLIFIFIEETIWSFKHCFHKTNQHSV